MDHRLPSARCSPPRRRHRAGPASPAAAPAGRPRALHRETALAARVATIDFETDPFKAGREPRAFACGWAAEGRTAVFWSEKEAEVIAWAVSQVESFRGGIVWAHNGGKFDLPGYLFKQGGRKLWGEPVKVVGSRIVQLRWGGTEIRDSYAILPAPLRDYDKGRISYAKFEKGVRSRHRREILDYLKRDVVSLRELVLRFVSMHGLRVLTAASAAMAAIKASGVRIDNFDERLDKKFRKWYFGGRVEVFRPGVTRGHFRVYDIKSAYPHAMLAEHATGKKFRHIRKPKEILGTDFVCLEGVVRGCFPQRSKSGLKFPSGPGTYFVTGWEYLAARLRSLLGRHRVLYVERCDRVSDFKTYVRTFYTQKAEAEARGDRAGKLIAKILINSGYGKLAQRPEKWRDFVIVGPRDVIPLHNPEGWREEMVDEACNYAVWSRPCAQPPHYYHVAAAASITGAVRARLIAHQGRRGLCYMDTDSVILCNQRLATGTGLGAWALEVEGDMLLIAGKKLYGLRVLPRYARTRAEAAAKGFHWYRGRAWKMATKGCRLTPLELAKVCAGKTVQYRNQAPTFSFTSPSRWISRSIRRTV